MLTPEDGACDPQEDECPKEWRDVYQAERVPLLKFAATFAPHLDWESAVEEAFVQLFIRWDAVRNPRHWLIRVTINILRDELQKHGPPVNITDDYLRLLKRSRGLLLVGPGRNAEHSQELSDTIAALCLLDAPRREAIILRANGVSDEEIAHLLGWEKRTVQRNICSARKEIGEAVGNLERRARANMNRETGFREGGSRER